MAYNIYVESYGCSANQSNAEIIKGILASKGFNIVNNEKIADVIVLNTCIVKGPTLKKIEARIVHFSKKKLIVTGCMPEIFSERIQKLARGASIVSVHHIREIAKAVKDVLEGRQVSFVGKSKEIKLNLPRVPQNKIIGIAQIAQGCVHNCAYCIVRIVKGELFSYPQAAILKDIANMLKQGCKEVWLTSQDNACYGCDRGKSELPLLLKEIFKLKGKFFVRVGMMHPSSLLPILDEMLECYENEKIFKFLHLPVQSGSDKVLRMMNRKYEVKDFLFAVSKFRKKFPQGTLSTDVIVGFPGETQKDFKRTLALVSKIKPDILNISKFWPMPNTKAAMLKKQVDEREKKARTITLMRLHNKICIENNKKLLGKRMKVLVDSKGFGDSWLARDKNYKLIVIKSQENLLGKIVDVVVEKAARHYLVCKMMHTRK